MDDTESHIPPKEEGKPRGLRLAMRRGASSSLVRGIGGRPRIDVFFPVGVSADPVTGLAVRTVLLNDLAEAVVPGSRPSLFAIFALDGFKEFEELYGVLEARKLLRRLSDRLLAVIDGLGTCY